MTRSEPIIRPAVAGDAERYYGGTALRSFRGFVVEQDGELLGILGVYHEKGMPVVFSEMKPTLRAKRRTIVKACRMLMKFLDNLGGRTYAVANTDEPTAPYFLVKIGFKPTGTFGPAGEIMARG